MPKPRPRDMLAKPARNAGIEVSMSAAFAHKQSLSTGTGRRGKACARALLSCMAMIAATASSLAFQSYAQSTAPNASSPPPASRSKPPDAEEKSSRQEHSATALPRGQKLVLKDGTFHIVRSLERKGERVRYYSVERSSWEEIPAAMVDWEVSKKAEADTAKNENALLEKVREREKIEKYQPVDIDASLQIAPNVFLPPGEGLFILEGTMVTPLDQVSAETRLDKKRQLEKIWVPMMSTRRRIQIQGAHAPVRITTTLPEFYLREAPPDPEHPSAVRTSSRPGESGPELELIHATPKSNTRLLEVLNTNIVGQQTERRNSISMQRWETAKGVYRFTLSEQLKPGEYAIALILPEGMNLYVWDFGVDLVREAEPGRKPAKEAPPPAKPQKPSDH